MLTETCDIIASPLCTIFQRSLDEGEVPEDWKLGNITPICKNGLRDDVCNYRPVSITSHVCKVIESLLKDVIVKHLDRHNIILDTQHEFWSGRSCLTNVLEFLEDVTHYVDQETPVDVINLDFQKAFEKVPHCRLSRKLESQGITGPIQRWIDNWLFDRKQRVVVNGIASS
jgi:hypothetical protein